MDLSFRKYLNILLLMLTLVLAVMSCSKDEPYSPIDIESNIGALQFNVLDDPLTRLAYDGVHASFTTGEAIGCVIAAKYGDSYQWKANTKWTYSENGILLLADNVEGLLSKRDPHESNGFVRLLDKTMTYAFFFYYPYTSEMDGTFPMAESQYLLAAPSEGNMTSYPMFVSTDYRENTIDRISHSEHLWVSHIQDPYAVESTSAEVSLTFERKTAALEIHCDHDSADPPAYTITDVWISVPDESNGVLRGVQMNLTDGTAVAYTGNSTLQERNAVYKGRLYPGQINPDSDHSDEDIYRMLLPAQTVSNWNLHAVITEDGSPQEYSVPLTKLSKLEEGKQYILHIAKAGNGSILIKDWESGSNTGLLPDFFQHLEMTSNRGTNAETGHVIVKPGEIVTIIGTELDLVAEIELVGAEVTEFDCDKSEEYDTNGGLWEITFTLPESARDGVVYIDTKAWEKASPGTIELVKPKATSLEPSTVASVGVDVVLAGENLDLVESITFAGGAIAPVKSWSDDGTSLTVTVPEYAQSGELVMNVKNGTSQSSGLILTVSTENYKPEVLDVTGIFKYDQQNAITVTGENLDMVDVITVSNVDDWDTDRVILNKSDGHFAYNEGDGTITFTYPQGAGENNGLAQIHFHVGEEHVDSYVALRPEITQDISRSTDYVYVFGNNMNAVTSVRLNHLENAEFDCISNNEISIDVWQSAGVTGVVELTAKHGYVTSRGYNFRPDAFPITIEPNPAKVGQEILISGTNLDLVGGVAFTGPGDTKVIVGKENPNPNEDPALASAPGSIMIVTVPSGAVSGPLTLFCIDFGTNKCETPYLQILSPSVTSIDNAARNDYGDCDVAVCPGEEVVIHGLNLDLIGKIKIGEVVISGGNNLEYDSGHNTLTFVFPELDPWTDGNIVMVTKEGDTEIVAGTYVRPIPTITEIVRDGGTVVFRGSNLDLGSVYLNDDGDEAITPQSRSASEIRISRFVTGIAGNIRIVTDYGDEVTKSFNFTPVVTYVSPNPISPGQELRINGQNLDLVDCVMFGTNDVNDKYGYVRVTPEEGNSDTPLVIRVPADAQNQACVLELRCVDYTTRVDYSPVTVNAFNGEDVAIWTGNAKGTQNITYDWASLDLKAGDQLIVYTDASVMENDEMVFTNLNDWSFNLKNGNGSDLADAQNPYMNSTGIMVVLTDNMINDLKNNNLRVADMNNCLLTKVSVVKMSNFVQPTIKSVTRENMLVHVDFEGFDNITVVSLNENQLTDNNGYYVNSTRVTIDLSQNNLINSMRFTGSIVLQGSNGSDYENYNFTPSVDTNLQSLGSLNNNVQITLTGNNLDLVENVVFTTSAGTENGYLNKISSTQIQVTIPNNAVTGMVKLDCLDSQNTQIVVGTITINGSGGGEIEVWTGSAVLNYNNVEIGNDNDLWINNELKSTDAVRIYFDISDPESDRWNIRVCSGHHWTELFSVANPTGSYIEFVVEDNIDPMTKTMGWGSALIMQGYNMTVTKVSIVR